VAKDLQIKAVLAAKDKMSSAVKRAAAAVRRRLSPALARASKMAKRLGSAMGTLGKGLALSAGALSAVGLAAYKVASDHAAALDEIGKFSRQINVTVVDLQELDYAMARQGLSTEVLRNGLNTLNTRLGESKAGLGKLHTFLKRMPKAFAEQVRAAKDTDEAFQIIIGAIHKVEDPAKKAALASVFFGKAIGPQMLRMAEVGNAGLKGLRAEAHKYGIATREQTDAAEKFVDVQENMNRTIAGLKIKIGSALLPIMEPLLLRLTGWIQANKDVVAVKVAAWVDLLVEKVQAATTAIANWDWDALLQQVRDLIDTVSGWDWTRIADGAKAAWSSIEEVADWVSKLVDKLGGWGSALTLLFGVKLAAALGGIPGLIIGISAAIINVSLRPLLNELDEVQKRLMEEKADNRLQNARLAASLQKRVNEAQSAGKALDVGVEKTMRRFNLYLDEGTGQVRAPRNTFDKLSLASSSIRRQHGGAPIPSRTQVEVVVKAEDGTRARAKTTTTGNVNATTTTRTAPTGTRGVGLPAGAGVAP
tara:strand:+ start:531 stop:2132 length:1602 start_codon:yes stop_codon:yes gene_type:complete